MGIPNLDTPLDVATFVHESGHVFGGLIDEYHSPAEKDMVITKNGGMPDNGFPNCAPDAVTADKWWKQTNLIPWNAEYFPACFGENYLVADEKNIMNNFQDFNPDHTFSDVQKYWLCRNMYSLTGKAYGACRTLKEKFGFERPLYLPIVR
jgi:hypothetical protein